MNYIFLIAVRWKCDQEHSCQIHIRPNKCSLIMTSFLKIKKTTNLNFHNDTIENSHHGCDIEQVQNERLISSENIATGNLNINFNETKTCPWEETQDLDGAWLESTNCQTNVNAILIKGIIYIITPSNNLE